LYPNAMVDTKWCTFHERATLVGTPLTLAFAHELQALMSVRHGANDAQPNYARAVIILSAIQEAYGRHVQERDVVGALQRARLKGLRRAAWLAFVVTLSLAPILLPTAASGVARAPLQFAYGSMQWIGWREVTTSAYLSMLNVAVFGALGGFLSTLLQVQRSRVSITEYKEHKYAGQLRPFVGAIIAMIFFVLLMWGVVPGLAVTNAGGYYMIAFVSGFSERYFLRALKLEEDTPVKVGG
jgi:hypothetical protein